MLCSCRLSNVLQHQRASGSQGLLNERLLRAHKEMVDRSSPGGGPRRREKEKGQRQEGLPLVCAVEAPGPMWRSGCSSCRNFMLHRRRRAVNLKQQLA